MRRSRVFFGVQAALALCTGIAAAQDRSPEANTAVDDAELLSVPSDFTEARMGGITADIAAARAEATSTNVAIAAHALTSAAAAVDRAWQAFLPRLSGVARYTRLSDFVSPTIPLGPGMAPIPGFAVLVDNWLFQATIAIPLSDYALRIEDSTAAAARAHEAAQSDVATARAAAATNARLAYYTWMSARGAVVVAVQTLNNQKTHLKAVRTQRAASSASQADELRSETAVASAMVALERARNLTTLAETQLRKAIHASQGEVLFPGEDLDSPPPPVVESLAELEREAIASRPEIKSAESSAASLNAQAAAASNARWPTLGIVADAVEADPNPRVFPPTKAWFGTWDVGVQLSWAVNDVLSSDVSVRDLRARAESAAAARSGLVDAIETEIVQTLSAVREADLSLVSTRKELASAAEAYRVALELFSTARSSSVELADAEAALTQARLDALSAKVTARAARVRLSHALGRDAHGPNEAPLVPR